MEILKCWGLGVLSSFYSFLYFSFPECFVLKSFSPVRKLQEWCCGKPCALHLSSPSASGLLPLLPVDTCTCIVSEPWRVTCQPHDTSAEIGTFSCIIGVDLRLRKQNREQFCGECRWASPHQLSPGFSLSPIGIHLVFVSCQAPFLSNSSSAFCRLFPIFPKIDSF